MQENAPGHRARGAQGQQEEHGLLRPAGGEHHGGQAQNGADDIEHGHRLLLGEAHVDEPMVDVAAVGVHGTLPVGDAADEGEGRVENRQAQHEEGHHEGDDCIELEEPLDRNHRQDEAQEGGPGIPHEDFRRVQVIGQEAQAAAHQGRHQEGHLGLPHHQGDDQQRHGADGGHAAGQAVQAVDEVDGIGDGHNPDDRHGVGQPAQVPVRIGGENVGVGDNLDDIPRADRNQGGDDLHHEFEGGPQGVNVVKNAQHHDDYRAQEHSPELRGDLHEDQRADEKAQENGQPAHAGDGVVVHPAVVLGHVHRAHLLGQDLHHRSENKSDNQRHAQRGGHHAYFLEFHVHAFYDSYPISPLRECGRRGRRPAQHRVSEPGYLGRKPTFL